jgi:putative endonuclease
VWKVTSEAHAPNAAAEWVRRVKRQYYVYILTNHSRTLYTGVTNDLMRRVQEHRTGQGSAFTSKYKLNQLVWYEAFPDIGTAIASEKQIKGWVSSRKIALIEAENPEWEDLAADLFGDGLESSGG